jgi:hypothetical protein
MNRVRAWLGENLPWVLLVGALVAFVVLFQLERVDRAKRSAVNLANQKAILASTDLLKDCVGLIEGGPCQARLAQGQAQSFELFKASLIEALRQEFGLLKGELVITVRQTSKEEQEITVEGRPQAPGSPSGPPPVGPPKPSGGASMPGKTVTAPASEPCSILRVDLLKQNVVRAGCPVP